MKMKWTEALIMFTFGICLRCWDVFSDTYLIYNLIVPKRCMPYEWDEYINEFQNGQELFAENDCSYEISMIFVSYHQSIFTSKSFTIIADKFCDLGYGNRSGFKCTNTKIPRCIPREWVCDGGGDCGLGDFSDEDQQLIDCRKYPFHYVL